MNRYKLGYHQRRVEKLLRTMLFYQPYNGKKQPARLTSNPNVKFSFKRIKNSNCILSRTHSGIYSSRTIFRDHIGSMIFFLSTPTDAVFIRLINTHALVPITKVNKSTFLMIKAYTVNHLPVIKITHEGDYSTCLLFIPVTIYHDKNNIHSILIQLFVELSYQLFQLFHSTFWTCSKFKLTFGNGNRLNLQVYQRSSVVQTVNMQQKVTGFVSWRITSKYILQIIKLRANNELTSGEK